MQEERKGQALTKVQYAWAKGDLRHFKGAHEDRAMQGAQQMSANGGPMSIIPTSATYLARNPH